MVGFLSPGRCLSSGSAMFWDLSFSNGGKLRIFGKAVRHGLLFPSPAELYVRVDSCVFLSNLLGILAKQPGASLQRCLFLDIIIILRR